MSSNKSGEVIDLDFGYDFCVDRTPRELISMLQSSFRDADFEKVASILSRREENLKQERESTVQATEWFKEKIDEIGMKKVKAESERDRKAESVGFWKKKYEELESRIRQLEADIMLLTANSRVSCENGDNLCEESPTAEDRRRPPSQSIIFISDNDSASEDILSRNEMTSLRVPKGGSSTETGPHCTGMLKRKHVSCSNADESNKSCNGVKDEIVNNNSLTADCKVEKVQKLSHGCDVYPMKECTKMAVAVRSCGDKVCGDSSQKGASEQGEAKMGAEYGVCNSSSSSSSSSSGSESDGDFDLVFRQFTGRIAR